MSDILQQAIAATRAGDTREAQQLLADELEANPENEYAWFLLGNLVDSPEKRKAYLGKALAINPQNAKAKQQYGQAQRQIASAASLDMDEAVELTAEDSDVPDWLEQLDADSTATAVSDDDILETVEDTVEERASVVAEKALVPAVSTPSKTEQERQLQRYNLMLIFLVLLIIVVAIFLINSL